MISPDDGDPFRFGEVGGRFKIGGLDTDNRFAVAQLPEIESRTRAAPLHRHHNEDEYIYVLEDTLNTMAGGDLDRLAQINEKYGIDMDFESVPELCARFELTFPELASER